MPFRCKRCYGKFTGFAGTQTMCASCVEKTEKHMEDLQENFDTLVRMTERPPVGFCDECTKIWIKRGEDALARLHDIIDRR